MKTNRKDVQEAVSSLKTLLENGNLFSVTNGWSDRITIEFVNEPGGEEDGHFESEGYDGKGSAEIQIWSVVEKLIRTLETVDFVEVENDK